MQSWHIHISGMVQGVGFRPHVYRLAQRLQLKGTVINSTNGVHITVTTEEANFHQFYQSLLQEPPANAIITHHEASLVPLQLFNEFSIRESEEHQPPSLMLTPDFGLCDKCKDELLNPQNRRFHYPFITCTECGPRYSIITSLPYDRPNTTMADYEQCWQCKEEYHDPINRRYYSQTNSCEDCGIPMHLYNSDGENVCNDYDCILVMLKEALQNGRIVAVKGIGGYLLMADATNYFAINTLRERKQRPSKPFAVLYPSVTIAAKDVILSEKETEALQSIAAPIVLCRLKAQKETGICADRIAPGLQKLGVLLPYSPLLLLIAENFGKPLIATSGNISGSPIIFNDDQALEYLGEIADFVLTYDRAIVTPQDDSVVQFSPVHQQQIILRRSRGLAPNYNPSPFNNQDEQILAMGAEMKGSFAIQQGNRSYISQYLGDQGSYESQQSYHHTLKQFSELIRFEADRCIADLHPGYAITEMAKNYAAEAGIPLVQVQHHEAHFAAVLAENQLLDATTPVLGVVWDGTGYGTDRQIWGSEFFCMKNQQIEHLAQLDYFSILMGDKMAREPRLSALSLCFNITGADQILIDKFTTTEWNHYRNQLQQHLPTVQTSSMGRFLDGVASLLGVADTVSYEGEAAMKLEALALQCKEPSNDTYTFTLSGNKVEWSNMMQQLILDLKQEMPTDKIAYKVHLSLAMLVQQVATRAAVKQIAFSGGVMQNALLIDLFKTCLENSFDLFFHQQLSPNDENISFGQLAIAQRSTRTGKKTLQEAATN